jgi:magnesium-dependent phosphatase 1
MENEILFVFDLDVTIWNCGDTWIDHTFPPYQKEKGKIYDARGNEMCLYPEIKVKYKQYFVFHVG